MVCCPPNPVDSDEKTDCLDDNDKDKKTLTNTNLSVAEECYTSTEWSQRVDRMLNSYVAIPVPSHTNQSTIIVSLIQFKSLLASLESLVMF